MALLRRLLNLLLLGGLLGAGTPDEYQVKAVFLYNFAQFVEWPSSAFADEQAPLAICVLGEDPFGARLDEVVRDEMVGKRPLIVRRLGSAGEAKGCHILFVSNSEADDLARIFQAVRGQSVLTVSDIDGFAARGGMVRMVTERNRIRLRIGLEAAVAAGLNISSKLLRLAEIVPTGGG